jgi:hypothetical protein
MAPMYRSIPYSSSANPYTFTLHISLSAFGNTFYDKNKSINEQLNAQNAQNCFHLYSQLKSKKHPLKCFIKRARDYAMQLHFRCKQVKLAISKL